METGRVIVSCTTTAQRLGMLFYAVESIKKQRVLPSRIQVNISREPYLGDTGIKEVSDWLNHELVDVKWVDNIGPFRKLLPAINGCSDNDLVVTMDDDILYHPEWLGNLLKSASTHYDCIVCARARYMKQSLLGGWQNYSHWHLASKATRALSMLPTGGAGAVYRRSLLDLDFLNDPRFLEISPTTDDLWFRMASLRKGVPVHVDPEIDAKNIYLIHHDGLGKVNFPGRKGSFLNKIYQRTVGYCRDTLGFDYYENDRAWTRVYDYSRNWKRPISGGSQVKNA
ncbi:glycosyltransferase [Halomonas stenophila]|uniref:Glycosyltransferase involved in cell wall biosynthesis n=1 Tax=Halomonas stenophila TaxID=795312 RepID=A0A7W5EQE3_9GAMM|nr:glycosyltransferase [Halomonas stenophila]MBB3229559.1 glycosyltransferase involved in cell wall biosynthesis [Halomonas stenophila]